MSLTDRYLEEVKKNLPDSKKQNGEEKAKSLLKAKMDEKGGYSEENERLAINELGNPRLLAESCLEEKYYLIGPELYGTYLKVLKIVAIIAVIGTAVGNTVDFVVNSKSVSQYLLVTLESAISAAIGTFGWLTLVFAIIEKKAKASFLKELQEDWNADDLPEEAAPAKLPSKVAIAIVIGFTVLWMILISGYSHLLGIYSVENGLRLFVPILNMEVFRPYIPYILGVLTLQLALALSRLIFYQWSYPYALTNLAINVLSLILLIRILNNSNILHPSFASWITNHVGLIENVWANIKKSVLIVFTIIYTIDSVSGFYDAYKGKQTTQNLPIEN